MEDIFKYHLLAISCNPSIALSFICNLNPVAASVMLAVIFAPMYEYLKNEINTHVFVQTFD